MIICVTGKMAAGKNFVSSLFEEKGFLCLDADRQVHSVIEKMTPEILKTFEPYAEKFNCQLKKTEAPEGTENSAGSEIVLQNGDGSLNRRELGRLLFSKPELLEKQEQIVYPALISDTKKIISENPEKNIVLNATVLYKVPELLALCSRIVFVDAPFFSRLLRARRRDHMKICQILDRFKAQKNLKELYRKSGIPMITVKNTGGKEKIRKVVEKITGRCGVSPLEG